ncbi:MAG: hypothetical protein Q7U38_01765 [Methylobacter sp.]|nr:hypothetical protein [Methylobacter sp.]MDZ4200646.1 hypothetical protein [Gallionella sp.]MDP2100278.1 hypothetical protein [Methylobacter sp.]MDP2428400.1 hypothetical protein [Methylobacter sp.]MDP3053088.1 hypothetical protein [Methylobacter sp.]
MKKIERLRTELIAYASALYHFVGGITVGLVLGIPTLFLFGDTLLSLLGHGLIALHILFEIFESITGHFLEWAFHLSKRTAEIIIFWSSLGVAIGLMGHLMRKAHIVARRAVTSVQERRLALAESSKIAVWIRIALIISSLSATLFLFT